MSTRINLTYCGMEGAGETVAKAKQDAARKIQAAMDGSYLPLILSAGQDTVILYRSPLSWQYGFLRNGELCSVQGSGNLDDCERAARFHIGQNATDWRKCFSAAEVHPIVHNDRDRMEIATTCQWQRDYHAAREAGLDDTNARYYIGGFTHLMTQPVPVKRPDANDYSIVDALPLT